MSQVTGRRAKRIHYSQDISEAKSTHVHRFVGGQGVEHIDPVLLLDVFEMQVGATAAGFEAHPHKGFDTLTLVLSGAVDHKDNQGNSGSAISGDMQWMRAGNGVIHEEKLRDGDDGAGARGVQLWLNLSSAEKGQPPQYALIKSDRIVQTNKKDGVVVKELGAALPVQSGLPERIEFLDVSFRPGSRVHREIEASSLLGLVIDGTVCVPDNDGGTIIVGPNAMVEFEPTSEAVDIDSDTGGRLLLIGGTPIGEPIVRKGPFVMNSREELKQAFANYSSGGFGPTIPSNGS